MKGENIQFDFHDKIDELRKELETKIDGKISDKTFWVIIGLVASAIGMLFYNLMSMNEKITRVETKVEMTQATIAQQNLPQPPARK